MKPFWIVLEGDYAEVACYEIQAESVEDVERLVRLKHHPYYWSIKTIFDTAPVQGDFDLYPYPFDKVAGQS